MARMRTNYRQEMRLLSTRGRVFWLVLGVAALLYLPSVLENQMIFGYTLSNTQLLGSRAAAGQLRADRDHRPRSR